MSCDDRQARADLEALFTGTLDGEGYERLREHALGCASCREQYERLTRVAQLREQRALPAAHQQAMEQALFGRLSLQQPAEDVARPEPVVAVSPKAVPVPVPAAATEREPGTGSNPAVRRIGRLPRVWSHRAIPAALLAAAVALLLVFIPNRLSRTDDWQSRSGGKGDTFGVRAFCVSTNGKVLAETGPGGTLRCPYGAVVQFAYTTPEAGSLTIQGPGPDMIFFPREGDGRVERGIDVPVPFSTPADPAWLKRPMEIRAEFKSDDGHGAVTTLQLAPAP